MIKDSLYTAFTSQINYTRYIEGKTEIVEGTTDFELLYAIYTGFLYTILFEDYFNVVKGQEVKTLLIDSYAEELISMIATKTELGYTFGEPGKNLGYSSKELAFYKLRSKIAHGDFYVEDGNIVFEEHESKGLINISNFAGMLIRLEDDGDNFKKCGENTRLIYINKTGSRHSISERNIDKLARKIYQVRVVDKPLPIRTRDKDYISYINFLREEDKKYIGNHPDLSIENYKNKFDQVASYYKEKNILDLKYTIEPIYNLTEYQEIKEKFLNEIRHLTSNGIKIDINNQIGLLSHTVYGIENENKTAIRKGIIMNLIVLGCLTKYPILTTQDIIKRVDPRIAKFLITNEDDMLIMSYLVGFYSLFQYGLETSLTKSNERKMYEIYDESKFDFSRLNLDPLETPTRINEMPLPKDEYSKENTNKAVIAKNRYEYLEKNYIEVVSIKSPDSETALKLKEKLNKAYFEYQDMKSKLVQDFSNYMNYIYSFDSNKYVKNLDIIYHIRNAISHGNIRIVKYGKERDDTIIRIIDKKDGRTGKIVYDKELTVKEFTEIFKGFNVIPLYDFLANNTDNNDIVEEDYLDKIMEISKKK